MLPFDKEEERYNIMNACKKHNELCIAHVDETNIELGDEVIKFTEASLEHVYTASVLCDKQHCIICGNDSGRKDTFKLLFPNQSLPLYGS